MLAEDVAKAMRFAPCQIRDPGGWYNVIRPFDGLWEGEQVSFEPVLRPLYMEYGARLYEAAAREAIERFPGFAEHIVEDGPDIQERRLVFTDRAHDLVLPFIVNRMYALDQDRAVSATESVVVGEVTPRIRVGDRRTLSLRVTLDRPATDEVTWQEVQGCFSSDRMLPLDPSPRQCSFGFVRPMLCDLSWHELAYLNWTEVRKPLTPADEALLAAVRTFDPTGIARSLAAGADPNALGDGDETPLTLLASTEPWHYVTLEDGESWDDLRRRSPLVSFEDRKACMEVLLDAGAHVDLCGPNGSTALTATALNKDDKLLEWLLAMGADDTADGYDDSSPGDWPPAWDFAASELTVEPGPDSERVWRLLRRYRQAPDGTRPGERPDW